MTARILVIEDDSTLRKLLVGLLTNAGHSVILASDGREGIVALERQPIDLVITDLFMPNQDGIETIMAMRRTHPKLPIIMMTGGYHFEADYYTRIAKTLGANKLLRKPFLAQDLYRLVTELLTISESS
jgi:CheY-like chemotaxis protein